MWSQLIVAAREVLDENGFKDIPLIVGTSAQSTKEIIELTQHAAEKGGDYVMVLPPSYFASSITEDALEDFYVEVSLIGYMCSEGVLKQAYETNRWQTLHPYHC